MSTVLSGGRLFAININVGPQLAREVYVLAINVSTFCLETAFVATTLHINHWPCSDQIGSDSFCLCPSVLFIRTVSESRWFVPCSIAEETPSLFHSHYYAIALTQAAEMVVVEMVVVGVAAVGQLEDDIITRK